MGNTNLILSLPQGIMTATSFTAAELASHRSPGAGKYFEGRSILVDLATANHKPSFDFLDEGGWRDAKADAISAMHSIDVDHQRTKTALSNNAFSCTPITAWEHVHLVKTGGESLALVDPTTLATFKSHECHEHMTPAEIGSLVGHAAPAAREPRLYMVLCPVEMLVLTNLTPTEYIWYATHRPGKKFRAVAFTEIFNDPSLRLASVSTLDHAAAELKGNGNKKTKTILLGDTLNRVPFTAWIGYDREAAGGMYVGDANVAKLWSFPTSIPRSWERAY
jgi:hypothetical protein